MADARLRRGLLPAQDLSAGRDRYDKALYNPAQPSRDVLDTRALDYLCSTANGTDEQARVRRTGGVGWLDLGDLAGDTTPTVNARPGGSGLRIDHLLVRLPETDTRTGTGTDVLVPGSYRVWIPDPATPGVGEHTRRRPGTHAYPSDHRYVTATVEL